MFEHVENILEAPKNEGIPSTRTHILLAFYCSENLFNTILIFPPKIHSDNILAYSFNFETMDFRRHFLSIAYKNAGPYTVLPTFN